VTAAVGMIVQLVAAPYIQRRTQESQISVQESHEQQKKNQQAGSPIFRVDHAAANDGGTDHVYTYNSDLPGSVLAAIDNMTADTAEGVSELRADYGEALMVTTGCPRGAVASCRGKSRIRIELTNIRTDVEVVNITDIRANVIQCSEPPRGTRRYSDNQGGGDILRGAVLLDGRDNRLYSVDDKGEPVAPYFYGGATVPAQASYEVEKGKSLTFDIVAIANTKACDWSMTITARAGSETQSIDVRNMTGQPFRTVALLADYGKDLVFNWEVACLVPRADYYLSAVEIARKYPERCDPP
jgi:hypothetical protein